MQLYMIFAAALLASAPNHSGPPVSRKGNVVVQLCDGETSLEVAGKRPGDPLSRDEAQTVSDMLMATWRRKNPGKMWEDIPRERVARNSADASKKPSVPLSGEIQVQTYGAFENRDAVIWQTSVQKFVDEGNRIFHDAGAMGGTIAVSCDMCHPNAANTHPETYPKYQVQLGRVALLRDMINWCIENPVRGKPLRDGDARLRAMESYILAQRKGVPLEYGKH